MDTKERRLNIVERYDWVAWVALGLVGAMFGVSDVLTGGRTFASGEAVLFEGITGMTWDELEVAEPGAARFIDFQERLAGGSILFGGLTTIAIAVLGLRHGQRWAWLTMWLVGPLSLVLTLTVLLSTEQVPGAGVPAPLIGQAIFLVITVALLSLTYRKYAGGLGTTIHINVRMQAKPGRQAELARRMLELGPDVHALGGTSTVTVDSSDETVLYFIETFPDQAAMDADMKTPLVQGLLADLDELTVHGSDFRIERMFAIPR